jgi:hypothetical protein
MVLSGLESANPKSTVILYSCFAPGSNSIFDFCYFVASIQTDGRNAVTLDFSVGSGWIFGNNKGLTV